MIVCYNFDFRYKFKSFDSYFENQILKAGLHGKYDFSSSFVTPSIDVDMDGIKSNNLILKNP